MRQLLNLRVILIFDIGDLLIQSLLYLPEDIEELRVASFLELTLFLDVFDHLLHLLISFLVIDHDIIPNFLDILLHLIKFFSLREIF